ncbi:MAG: hypothetical protein ACYC64_14355 [Armatimonadota bacterium]
MQKFVSGTSAGFALYLVDTSGGSNRLFAVIQDANDPTWSPDSNEIAYTHELNRIIKLNISESAIAVYSFKDGLTTVMPASGYVDRLPSWRENGRDIAFARVDFRKTRPESQLVIVQKIGSKFNKPRFVGAKRNHIGIPRWRPLRNEIGYIGAIYNYSGSFKQTLRNMRDDLELLNIERNEVVKLFSRGQRNFPWNWSPDGKHVALASGLNELEMLNVDTHARRVILHASDLDKAEISDIRWSPDRNRIAIEVLHRQPTGGADIAMLDMPSGRFTWLTSDRNSRAPRWSSDGQKVLYVRGGTEIWQMTPTGSGLKKLYALSGQSKPESLYHIGGKAAR